jgi:hypothetical protein
MVRKRAMSFAVTGLLATGIAVLGGMAFVFKSAPAAACRDSKYPVSSCGDCITEGANWGKSECDFRSGASYGYCIASGDDCYSD